MIQNIISIIEEVLAIEGQSNPITSLIPTIFREHGMNVIKDDFNFINRLATTDASEEDEPLFYEPKGNGEFDEQTKAFLQPIEEHRRHKKKTEKSEVTDLRFKSLSLSNFRKFPQGGHPYGMVTSIKDKPTNTIIYGGNGCGKSSVYDALQLMFTGQITNNKQKTPHYGGSDANKLEIEVTTPSGAYTWKGVASGVGGKDNTANNIPAEVKSLLPAFFCSEDDILSLSINDIIRLNQYLYRQIGYGGAYAFYQFLQRLHAIVESDHRYELDGDAAPEQLKQEKARRLNQLLSDLDLKEEGMRDTFHSQALLHKYEQKDLQSLFKTFHENIAFSYDEESDNVGKMSGRRDRFEQLGAEIKGIISQLDNEKKQFHSIVKEDYPFFDTLYDSTIQKFRAVLLESCKGDIHKFKAMKICYGKMNQLQQDLPKINKRFKYHLNRIKSIIDCDHNPEAVCDFYFHETNEWMQMYDEKATLNGEKENEDSHRKLHELDPYLYPFMKEYRRIMGERINNVLQPMKETIATILKDFDMDGDSVSVDYDDKTNELSVRYKMENTSGDTIASFSPSEYLNSFRLKTYCITVKIALAFAIMQAYNFVFPLVFDDVIFACDFNNRSGVKQFIRHIFDCYRRQCHSLSQKYPLQLIFFTHDDVVFEAAVYAFDDCNNRIAGRMFDYRDVDEQDLNKDKSFYNLYVRK